MEETARDRPTTAACGAKVTTFAIGQPGEGRIGANVDLDGVVEFMAAEMLTCVTERPIGQQASAAVAQMQPPPCEAGAVGQQANHGVVNTLGIG
jgi:hypothetical protein